MSEKALPKARGKAAVGKLARRSSPGQPPKGRNLFSGKLPHPNGGGNKSKGRGPLRLGEPGPGHFPGNHLSKGRRETPVSANCTNFPVGFYYTCFTSFRQGDSFGGFVSLLGVPADFWCQSVRPKYSQRPEKFSGREKFFPKGCGLAMVRGSGYNLSACF